MYRTIENEVDITSLFPSMFITSDHHFGHANIIKYCKRRFNSASEMDDVMIERWNKVVGANDYVFHLGDFTLNADAESYFSQLNGNVLMLKYGWHHDKYWISRSRSSTLIKTKTGTVTFVSPLIVVYVKSKHRDMQIPFMLCHYPIASHEGMHYGGVHLHGHVHSKSNPSSGSVFDVGVDANRYYPVKVRKFIDIAEKNLLTIFAK